MVGINRKSKNSSEVNAVNNVNPTSKILKNQHRNENSVSELLDVSSRIDRTAYLPDEDSIETHVEKQSPRVNAQDKKVLEQRKQAEQLVQATLDRCLEAIQNDFDRYKLKNSGSRVIQSGITGKTKIKLKKDIKHILDSVSPLLLKIRTDNDETFDPFMRLIALDKTGALKKILTSRSRMDEDEVKLQIRQYLLDLENFDDLDEIKDVLKHISQRCHLESRKIDEQNSVRENTMYLSDCIFKVRFNLRKVIRGYYKGIHDEHTNMLADSVEKVEKVFRNLEDSIGIRTDEFVDPLFSDSIPSVVAFENSQFDSEKTRSKTDEVDKELAALKNKAKYHVDEMRSSIRDYYEIVQGESTKFAQLALVKFEGVN